MTNGKNYSYKQIEAFASENNYELTEYGPGTIGISFIVLTGNDVDCAISFVLDGYNSVRGNLYTCIYSDLK